MCGNNSHQFNGCEGEADVTMSGGVEPAVRPASVKSAMRVFEILEKFKEVRQPLRLKDLCEHLGYPVSSTAALIKTIADQGYLHFDQTSRAYFPTPRLAQLTNWVGGANFEHGPVLDAMRRLQRMTGELSVLGTPIGIHMEYVETLRATHVIQLYNPPGTRRLLVQLGMGWLMLSRMPEATATAIYKRTVTLGKVDATEFPLEDFLARLAQMRKQDFAFTRASDYVRPNTAHWGGAMISMLVPVPPNHRRLAIGIGGPAQRLDDNHDALLAALRTEIARLSEQAESF